MVDSLSVLYRDDPIRLRLMTLYCEIATVPDGSV